MRRSRRPRDDGQRRQRRAGRGRRHAAGPPPSPEQLLGAAVGAWETEPEVYPTVLRLLEDLAHDGAPVHDLVMARLTAEVDALWRRGWAPAEVAHVVARRLSPAHVAVAASAITADATRRAHDGVGCHPRWRAQLDGLAPAVDAADAPIRTSLPVLALLTRLGPIPASLPRPGEQVDLDAIGLDEKVLARVRALLAKAESTTFDEEAEALSTKAQELIARHAIDTALLRDPDDVGAPAVRRIGVPSPYERAKALLVSEVARANRCRAVHRDDHGWVTVFGYGVELDAVEVLSASLLAQATGAMARQGPRRDAAGRSTTRSYRRAFLLGFATRIGDRLRDAVAGEVAAADAAHGRLVPVLAARDDRLEQAIDDAFPTVVRRSTRVSNASGWSAGMVAADLADLSVAPGRLDH